MSFSMRFPLVAFVLLGTLLQGCSSQIYTRLLQSFCKNPVGSETSEPSYIYFSSFGPRFNFTAESACPRCFATVQKDNKVYIGERLVAQSFYGKFDFTLTGDCDVQVTHLEEVPFCNWNFRLLRNNQPFATVRYHKAVPSTNFILLKSGEVQLLIPKSPEHNISVAAAILPGCNTAASGLDWAPPVGKRESSLEGRNFYRDVSQGIHVLASIGPDGYNDVDRRSIAFVTNDRRVYQIHKPNGECTLDVKMTDGIYSSARLGVAGEPVHKFENNSFKLTGTGVGTCRFHSYTLMRTEYLSKAVLRQPNGERWGVFLEGDIHGPSQYYVAKVGLNGVYFAYDYEGFDFFTDGQNFYLFRTVVESLDEYLIYPFKNRAQIRTSCLNINSFSTATIHNDSSATITQKDALCGNCAIDTSQIFDFGLVKVGDANVFYFVKNKVAVNARLAPHCSITLDDFVL